MYKFLDLFLLLLHSLIILFNLTGWIWPKTRPFHFYLVMITAFSWIVPGFWYGFGYCFLTDWHYDIKRELGESGMPNSFIEYLLEEIFSVDFNTALVEWSTGIVFLLIVFAAVYYRFFHNR